MTFSEKPASLSAAPPLDNFSEASVTCRVNVVADFKLAASGSGIEMEWAGELAALATTRLAAGRAADLFPKIEEECLLVCEEGWLTVASPGGSVPTVGAMVEPLGLATKLVEMVNRSIADWSN